jgi:hypothetical protein
MKEAGHMAEATDGPVQRFHRFVRLEDATVYVVLCAPGPRSHSYVVGVYLEQESAEAAAEKWARSLRTSKRDRNPVVRLHTSKVES